MSSAFQDYGGYVGGGGYAAGGGGGGGGGGFDDPVQGGYLQGGNQADGGAGAGSGKKGGLHNQPLLTTTILALTNAPEEQDKSLLVEDKAFGRVYIMGKVVSMKDTETAKTVVIHDGTASVSVSMWNNPEDPPLIAAQRAAIQEGIYVKCYGTPRRFNNVWVVNATSMTPIKDMNEFTHHLLEAMFVRLQLRKGPLNMNLGPKAYAAQDYGSTSNNTFGVPISASAGGFQSNNGLSGSHKLVHDVFAQDTVSEEGYTINFVAERLKGKGITVSQVKQICDMLVSDGHLYSTVDDEHYKSTGTFL